MIAKRSRQLVAGADVQLSEHLVEVVGHGVRTDEQLGCDLGVRLALGGEPGDLVFLRGELVARLGCPNPWVFAGGEQLDPGTVRERAGADRVEHLSGGPQMYAGVAASARRRSHSP